VDKPFIAQEFLFSKFWGNPRRRCAEQIKNGVAAARKKRTWLPWPFSRA
jgi:hypothetical protein